MTQQRNIIKKSTLFFKKYHNKLGLIFIFLSLLFAFSGIVLNHRTYFSGTDVNRNYLPSKYSYKNWNLAAVKAIEKINNDSILIYGNIGIWLTDSNFQKFTDFNLGIPKGSDNRKTCAILYSKKKNLYAGTLFGIYKYGFQQKKWIKIPFEIEEKRVFDLLEHNDSIYAVTRSHIIISQDKNKPEFTELKLPAREGYDNKVTLFKTLWTLHSGELFGHFGKMFVDFIAIIFIILSVTGLIKFFFPRWTRKRLKSDKQSIKIMKFNAKSLKWHNKLGVWFLFFLIVTTISGMFLRPPMLIPIAGKRVGKIPYTHLDKPNPWFDILRNIMYDSENKQFLIATTEGVYYSNDNFKSELKKFVYQPPISLMGVNVFKKTAPNEYLIGTFLGLVEWNSETGFIFDYITGKPYEPPKRTGSPVGENKVVGYMQNGNDEFFFEYDRGLTSIKGNKKIVMSDEISSTGMSLWSVALETHTGRIFSNFLGAFYILIVPITALFLVFILISGFIVWRRLYKKVKK